MDIVTDASENHYINQEARTLNERAVPSGLEPLMHEISTDGRKLVRKILLDISCDGCVCACSVQGCLPITYFLKATKLCRIARILPYLSSWKLRWLLVNLLPESFPLTVNHAILRLNTFEKLRLRHTCCHRVERGYETYYERCDEQEAKEIKDEDQEGIQLLESILPEFEDKLGNGNIESFLNGYWAVRMEDVLKARDEEPLDVAALEALGVKVYEHSSSLSQKIDDSSTKSSIEEVNDSDDGNAADA